MFWVLSVPAWQETGAWGLASWRWGKTGHCGWRGWTNPYTTINEKWLTLSAQPQFHCACHFQPPSGPHDCVLYFKWSISKNGIVCMPKYRDTVGHYFIWQLSVASVYRFIYPINPIHAAHRPHAQGNSGRNKWYLSDRVSVLCCRTSKTIPCVWSLYLRSTKLWVSTASNTRRQETASHELT